MNPRAVALPVASALLVAAVLGTQVAAGGGDFVPARAADPCLPRVVPEVSTGLDGLSEQLVLIGLDAAACRLGLSREALVLRLGTEATPSGELTDAVRAGLLEAVERLDREGKLPTVSSLREEVLAEADLNALLERAVRALPDALIDNRLPTDELLRAAIDELDLPALLSGLDDPDAVQRLVRDAVTQAAVDLLISGINPFD